MGKQEQFSDRLVRIVKHLGITQSEFGKKVGLSRPGLSRLLYDGGKPRFEVLARFHDVLELDLNWLVSGKGIPFGEELPVKMEKVAPDPEDDLKVQLLKKDLEAARMEIAYLKQSVADKEAIINSRSQVGA